MSDDINTDVETPRATVFINFLCGGFTESVLDIAP
jgi:hypothetical protein